LQRFEFIAYCIVEAEFVPSL